MANIKQRSVLVVVLAIAAFALASTTFVLVGSGTGGGVHFGPIFTTWQTQQRSGPVQPVTPASAPPPAFSAG